MERRARKTGIDCIGDVPWGTHLCLFYQTKEDLIEILVPCLRAGLENNEFCMWVTSDVIREDEAKRAMEKAVPDFSRYLREGQVEIVAHDEWYLKDGVFNLQRILGAWADKLEQALAKGYDGIRVTGNAAWLEREGWANFIEYEREVNKVIGEYLMLAICTYSLDRCGVGEIIDAADAHQCVIIRREGKWAAIESKRQIRAQEKLRESEVRFRKFFEDSPLGIAISGPDRQFTNVNSKFCEMLGYAPEEIIGTTFVDITHPVDVEKDRENIDKMSRGETTIYKTEKRYIKKNKEMFWAFTTVSGVYDDEGTLLYYLAMVDDITERKRAEEEIKVLSHAVDGAIDSIAITDLKGIITYANSAMEETYGYKKGEMLGELVASLNANPETANEIMSTMIKIGSWHGEIEALKKNKETFPALLSLSTVRDEKDNPIAMMGALRDITEHKQTEARLELRLGFQNVISTISSRFVGISDLDDTINTSLGDIGRLGKASRAYLFLLRENGTVMDNTHEWRAEGVSPQISNLQNLPCEMFPWWMDRLRHGETIHIQDVSKMPEEAQAEKELLESQNIKSLLVLPVRVQEELVGFIGFDNVASTWEWHDEDLSLLSIVSEIIGNALGRKRSDESLRHSEQRYRELADSLPEIVFEVDIMGNLTYINCPGLESFGYTHDDFVKGLNAAQLVPPEWRDGALEYIQQLSKGGESGSEEYTGLRKDGSKFPVLVRYEPIVRGGKVTGLRGIAFDITEHKKAEDQLRAEKDKAQKYLDIAGVIILAIDSEQKVTLINRKGCEVLGYEEEEIVGKNWLDNFIPPRLRRKVTAVCQGLLNGTAEAVAYYENPVLTKSGEERIVAWHNTVLRDDKGNVTGHLSSGEDITERKRMETERAELEQKAQLASRLASVGEMASGVAHEINNPLTSIIGFSQLVMRKDVPDNIIKDLQTINSEAQRVARIVEGLLTFARQRKPGRAYVDINDIISQLLELRSYEMKVNNIQVETRLAPDVPKTMADAGQLQQVFLNIVVNAEKEMTKAHSAGKLVVKTEKTGDTIRIQFVDDGPGISKENLGRIFDPFFTTRPVGNGTGLGLSISHGIIAEHRGRIYAKSELGKGATFVVELPVVADNKRKAKADAIEEEPWQKQGARILVVDDEQAILDFLHDLLTGEGYQVEVIDRADAALKRLQSEHYDLILLDIKLPGMNGIELYRRVEAIEPTLCQSIAFITGDVMEPSTRDFLEQTGASHIAKPFNIGHLRKEVNRILSRDQDNNRGNK